MLELWPPVDSIAVGISAFILRVGYRLLKEPGILYSPFSLKGDEGDVMTHFVIIDLIRRNNCRIPRETPRFTLAGELDYPAFYHKILSYFPRHWIERGECLISPAIEGAHAALVYLAAWWIFAEHLGVTTARAEALLVAAGWIVAPLLVFNPRRGSMIGERSFGYLFSNIFLFAVAMLIATGNVWWLSLSTPAFALTMASSKFGLQAITFVGAIIAILVQSLWPILAIVIGLVFATIVSFGYVLRVLAGSVNHSWFYLSFLSRTHIYTNSFSHENLIQAARALVAGRIKDARVYWLKHPLRLIATLNPWIVAPALIAIQILSVPAGPISGILTTWSWATIIVAVATMSDWLKFLGEGERYIEVGLFPMLALSVALDSPLQPLLVFMGIAYSLWRLLGTYMASGAVSTASPEMLDLLKWLNGRQSMVLLPVPGRISLPIAYETPHRLVWCPLNAPRGSKFHLWRSFFSEGTVYPYVAPKHIAVANRKYGADAFVVDKRSCAIAERSWSVRYDFSGLPVLYENARYGVIGASPIDFNQYTGSAK